MQDHARLTEVHLSKHSLFRLKITVGCSPCTCPSIRVCVLVCVVVVMCVVCRGDVCVSSSLAPKTLPCVRLKRPCRKGHGRFERTNENVFNVHTGASLSPLAPLFPRFLSLSLLFLSSSLSKNDSDHSSSRLSLYAQL